MKISESESDFLRSYEEKSIAALGIEYRPRLCLGPGLTNEHIDFVSYCSQD